MNYNILSKLTINKIYSAMTIFTAKNSMEKRIDRPYWAIIIKYEGETIYTVNGEKIISNATNPVILPKGCSYEWQCIKSGHFCVIEFDAEITCKDIFSFKIRDCDKLLKIFKTIEFQTTSKAPMYELKAIMNTYSIILSLLERVDVYYINSYKKKKIQPAIDFIAENYNKRIKNDVLAEKCNISTTYFRKLFREIFEVAPISYIHSLRIKKAKEMLKSDHGNISNIALSLGYNSIYEFSKAFKNHTGISPSEYQKGHY